MERLFMLNIATLSTWMHLVPKPAQKTLNHV